MSYVITLLSAIPFFAYIYLLTKEELLINRKDHKIFRFDTLILFAIFIYFATHKVEFVNQMLFFTINLYLFVNKLYDKNIKEKLNKKKHMVKIIIIYILAVMTFIPYVFMNKLTNSYYLAFILILMFHFIFIPINKYVGKNKKKKRKKTKI